MKSGWRSFWRALDLRDRSVAWVWGTGLSLAALIFLISTLISYVGVRAVEARARASLVEQVRILSETQSLVGEMMEACKLDPALSESVPDSLDSPLGGEESLENASPEDW